MPPKLSKEDLALWDAITKGINPIERDQVVEPAPPKRKIIIEQKSQNPAHIKTNAPKDHSPQSLTRQQYRTYTVDARLDLHGYTQEKAYDTLVRFVLSSYQHQRRTLLIITGKGVDGQGILKQQLPRWLESDALKVLVLATAPARPEDGGQGALYVLLRRIR